jgi:PTH1 family peptidyl-tRNA hydrolase
VVDALAARAGITFEMAPAPAAALVARLREPGGLVLLAKPLTMMNLSGEAVAALARYYRIEPADMLVVADDVALPLGRLRARARGSAGGHNGFKSIARHLGTEDWPRLRLGVGRGDDRRDLADHVLARFEPGEEAAVNEMIERAADAVQVFVSDGIEAVMNRFNAPPTEEISEHDRKDSQS